MTLPPGISSPDRIVLSGPQLTACTRVAEATLASSRERTRALHEQLDAARPRRRSRLRQIDDAHWLLLAMIAVATLPIWAQVAATAWTMLGGRTDGMTEALVQLSRFRIFAVRPFGILDDLWASWLRGQNGFTSDGVPLKWVAPAVMHAIAAVAGLAGLAALAWTWWRHVNDRWVGEPFLAAVALLAAWTVLSLQIWVAGLLLVLDLAVVSGLVLLPALFRE